MGDDEGGDAEALLQLAQFHLHVLAQIGVERRERFVEQEDLGIDGEAARDGDALALAAGQLMDAPRAEAGQLHEFEQGLDPLHPRAPADAADRERIGDVVGDVEMGKQRERLEDHAEFAPVRRQCGDLAAARMQAPGARLLEPGNQPQQRRLAATGGAEQADEGAGGDVDREVVDRREAAETLAHASK